MSAHSNAQPDKLQHLLQSGKVVLRVFRELWFGVRTNSLPWAPCGGVGLFFAAAILRHWDVAVFRHFGILALYPRNTLVFAIYVTFALSAGFLACALTRAVLYSRFVKRLERALITSGLKNRLGYTPRILDDVPLDENTRKLRITSANFPKKDFDSARAALETGMRVYIDEIREDRIYGCFDVIYSGIPMPSSAAWVGTEGLRKSQFCIGKTRAKSIIGNLAETPHLLVAGQTGGGKSTFLRQLITTLYLNDRSMQFTLIDLKGGLEFQLFEGLPRATVLPSIETSIAALQNLQSLMTTRMTLLREHGAKDLDALVRKTRASKEPGNVKIESLGRHLIVVDEATEMFLTGSHASATLIQSARRVLSQLARQGRAVGIHLVIATQRPDSRALDPQVKANLTGVLCFQMANDASSMVVLGNGRATDLPAIPGRAIWKNGIEMREVQTSLLLSEQAEAVLLPYRTSTPPKPAKDPLAAVTKTVARAEASEFNDAPKAKRIHVPQAEGAN